MRTIDIRQHQPEPESLAEHVILVTGASKGLGRQVASRAASLGATVILHGRDVIRLEHLYDEIVGQGFAEPMILPLDLATATDRDFNEMAGAVEAQLQRLDGIVHCAADLIAAAPIEQQRLDDWTRTFRVNTIAPAALTRACARLLRAAPDASVVFTGDTHGQHPAAFWGGYAIAKSSLSTLSTILSQEWAQWEHMRANVIVPGRIDSPMRSKTHPGEHPRERAPMETMLPAYMYLLCPASRGITGQTYEF